MPSWPYLESYQFNVDTTEIERDKKWKKKLLDESLLFINENQIRLTTDPLFNFTLGPQNAVKDFFYSSNVRGFRITGDVTSKLSFEKIKYLYFYEANRWDIEFKNNVILKLPKDLTVKSLNDIIVFLNDKKFEKIKIVDARINNQIIVND